LAEEGNSTSVWGLGFRVYGLGFVAGGAFFFERVLNTAAQEQRFFALFRCLLLLYYFSQKRSRDIVRLLSSSRSFSLDRIVRLRASSHGQTLKPDHFFYLRILRRRRGRKQAEEDERKRKNR